MILTGVLLPPRCGQAYCALRAVLFSLAPFLRGEGRGERLSGLSSCIGVFGTRFASFCVESDEELAGQGNANDHFLFAGLEQPVAKLAEAAIVAGGNGRDEEED